MTQEQVTLDMISRPVDILDYPIYLTSEELEEIKENDNESINMERN